MIRNDVPIRVGFGCTALARGLVSGGLDGIGNVSMELYRELSLLGGLDVSPVTFGYDLPEGLNFRDNIRLPNFSASTALSLLSGRPFLCESSLNSRVDIFHATDHRIPRLAGIPVVSTIHDLIPFEYPEWVSRKFRYLMLPAFRRSISWTDKIITISEYSKASIMRYFNVPSSSVTVIPNAVGEAWFSEVSGDQASSVRGKYGLSRDYIIAVGTLQPRKNYTRLVEAFRQLPPALRRELSLVIVGRDGWRSDDLVRTLRADGHSDNIIWLEAVPQPDLHALVSQASCLAFPSLAEGFGLPVLEAFAAGTPVVASNTTSIPEVAGNAAELVDPEDIDSITAGLTRVIDSPSHATELVELGRLRARQFSWQRSARETEAIYRTLL